MERSEVLGFNVGLLAPLLNIYSYLPLSSLGWQVKIKNIFSLAWSEITAAVFSKFFPRKVGNTLWQ